VTKAAPATNAATTRMPKRGASTLSLRTNLAANLRGPPYLTASGMSAYGRFLGAWFGAVRTHLVAQPDIVSQEPHIGIVVPHWNGQAAMLLPDRAAFSKGR
jgi:hypothetical protein